MAGCLLLLPKPGWLSFVTAQAWLAVFCYSPGLLKVVAVPACWFVSPSLLLSYSPDLLVCYSPSLLFLSQSLLCPDGSMRVRVAHELCHTWFGIVIGPLDWTEEWLTEGFCTYLEDLLHAQVLQVRSRCKVM